MKAGRKTFTDVCNAGIITYMWWYAQDGLTPEISPESLQRILIFEDSPIMQETLKLGLELELGVKPVVISTSSAMLKIIHALQPDNPKNPQVLILDVSAEGKDVGLDIYRAMREIQASCIAQRGNLPPNLDPKIIFLTSNTETAHEKLPSIDAEFSLRFRQVKPRSSSIVPKGEMGQLLNVIRR